MKSSKLIKNSSFSVLQTIVTAITALLLFKVMVLHEGLKITGLWSFLASINAITGFGSYGFASALLFHIPKYQLLGDNKKLGALINTSFLTVLSFTAALCLVSFLIFSFIIPHTVESGFVSQAKDLLPYVVLSFFFSGLSTTYLSILDGLMLMHVRAKITITGSLIFLVAGYFLLQKNGIAGIAIAQLLQNVFLLATSFIYVKKHIPSYRFSVVFDTGIFRNIFRYGFNFQLISVTQIISDPFMKSMITRYAGMNSTAMFDFCIKLLSVFRSLLISANQSIVPQITVYKTMGRQMRINTFYKANFKIVLFASILFFISPIALSDIIAVFFLNHTSSEFNFILLNVSLGLLVNAIAMPAYFYYLGIGNLKWNVINNVVTASLILLFTPIVGELTGGNAVIICWSVSAVIGSSILLLNINRQNNFSSIRFFDTDNLKLFLAISISVVINHYLNQLQAIKNSHFIMIVADILVLALCLLYPLLVHPTVRKILMRVRKVI